LDHITKRVPRSRPLRPPRHWSPQETLTTRTSRSCARAGTALVSASSAREPPEAERTALVSNSATPERVTAGGAPCVEPHRRHEGPSRSPLTRETRSACDAGKMKDLRLSRGPAEIALPSVFEPTKPGVVPLIIIVDH